jgi:structural maintenance of chromosome 2
VRVGSLQELVYKNGQAGVTKASVSIVFNNEDKANSPGGYQHYDQITVTRQVHEHHHVLIEVVWR